MRSRTTHGRCRSCNVIWRWQGAPLLKDAHCPTRDCQNRFVCMRKLERTCAALVRRVPIRDDDPVYLVNA